jgi:predicted  nucleic acid-binding Zn-ribbon protein
MKTAIPILCPVHGEFRQSPYTHLRSEHGCPKCGNRPEKIKELYSKELGLRFSSVADAAAYIGRNKRSLWESLKVGRKCGRSSVTGERLSWEPATHAHKNARLVPKSECNRLPSEDIKSKAYFSRVAAIHGNKYDYSKATYNGSGCRVTIICPKHGEFEQCADLHSRSGCPACGKEAMQRTGVSVYSPQLGRTFCSINEVSKFVVKSHGAVTAAICEGRKCGVHPDTGEPLSWQLKARVKPIDPAEIYCKELDMCFHTMTAAASYVGRTKAAISFAVTKGGSCGKHPETGVRLTWVRTA